MRGVALALVTTAFLGCACTPCRATARRTTAGLAEVLQDGTYLQLQEFTGASKWAVLQHMFTSATVRVECPGHQDFVVYTGRSVDDLRSLHSRKDRAWCGWDRFAGRSPEVCIAPVSPFGSTIVAVAQPKSWFAGAAGPSSCRMTRREEFSMPRFLAAVAGTFLFWSAPALSESTPFRLTGGTVGFVALSLVVALFVLYRTIPHKRTFAISTAIFGGTLAAALRWAFGTWLPSVPQLARNPVVVAYLLLSGLLGLALSYYYNDTSNQKVNTMLRVALQLAGLALVGGSASLPGGSAAAVSALLAAKVAATAARERALRPSMRHAKQQRAGVMPEQAPEPPREEAPAAQPPTTPGAATAAAQQVSPLVLRGLILNEETGKIIQIGKGVYNRLVVAGHIVDTCAGTITPPPEVAVAAERGSGGRRRSGSPVQRRRRD